MLRKHGGPEEEAAKKTANERQAELGSLTKAGYIAREHRKAHEQELEKIAQEGVKAMYPLN